MRSIAVLLLCLLVLESSSAQPAEFSPPATYGIGGASYVVVPVDLDGDGTPDLVAASFHDDGVSVLLNEGGGTYGSATIYEVANAIRTVAAGDFTGDGVPDVLAAAGLEVLYLLPGLGDGTLGIPVPYEAQGFGGNAVDLAVADFDGDGDLDAAVLGADVALVHSWSSPAGFSVTAVLQGLEGSFQHGAIVAADLDGQNGPDLAIANAESEVLVALNDGEGGFPAPSRISAGVFAFGLAADDFDGDGDIDLAASSDGSVRTFVNDGEGAFSEGDWPSAPGFAPAWSLSSGDINLDGAVDLVATASSSGLMPYYGDGEGSFTAGESIPMALGNAYGLAVHDVDGDAKPDLVATDTNTLENELSVVLNLTTALAPAVAVDDSYETDQNQNLVVPAPGVLANDSGTGTLTAVKLTNPSSGEADILPDGTLTYFPATDFDGSDSFSYQVIDGNGQTDLATVFITVNAGPEPPTAEPLFLSVDTEVPGDEPYIVRKRPGTVNIEHLATIAAGEEGQILLNLFDDVEVPAYQERAEWRGEAHFTWYGLVFNDEFSRIIMVVNLENSTVTGSISTALGDFRIRPSGGLHEVREIDASAFPEGDDTPEDEEDEPAGKRTAESGTLVAPSGAATDHSVIDMLVLYTDDAVAANPDILSEIQLAADETNDGFEQSGVNAEIRVVRTREWSYEETGDGRQDRNRLRRTSDGWFDYAHTLRDEVGADVVVLVVEDAGDNLCGVAYIMKQNDGSFRDRAFFVVERSCMTGPQFTFPHELGHVLGARHDRFVDIGTNPFPYSHGHLDVGDRWRTMMAYNNACDCSDEIATPCPLKPFRVTKDEPVCPKLNRWSDPNASFNNTGEPDPGGPLGIADLADNVRTLNNTVATVAAYSDARFYQVEGVVTLQSSGDPLEGIEIIGFPDPVQTDAGGEYAALVPIHWSGTVIPVNDTLSFHPEEKTFTDVTSDRTQDFEGAERIVRGHIWVEATGKSLDGVRLDGFPEPVETDSRGYYEIEVEDGWTGVVVPRLEPYRFDPPSVVFGPVRAPEEQNFLAHGPPTIYGTITDAQTGDPIEGASLVGFLEPAVTDASGKYAGQVDWVWSGDIVPMIHGYNFTPTSRHYQDVTSEITGQDYTGTPGVYPDADWPMPGRNPQRMRSGQGPPVSPDPRWSVFANDLLPVKPVVGPGGLLYSLTRDQVPDTGPVLHLYDRQGREVWQGEVWSDGRLIGMSVGAGGTAYLTRDMNGAPYPSVFAIVPGTEGYQWYAALDYEAPSSEPAIGGSGDLYIGTGEGNLFALDSQDGSEQWKFETGGNEVTPSALAGDGTIYFGAGTTEIFAVNPDGTSKWQFATDGKVLSAPVVAPDGTVHAGTDAGWLYAVNPDGSMKWRFGTDREIGLSPAIGVDGGIFVVDDGGTVYAVDPTGSEQWRHTVGSPARTSPIVATYSTPLLGLLPGVDQTETVVYVATHTRLYAVNGGGTFTQSVPGTLRWSYDVSGGFETSMAHSFSDNTLYLTTYEHVYAFGAQPAGGGSGLVQLTSLGTYVDPDVLELKDNLHIIIAFAENGFGGDAIVGGLPDDPCMGGPLFIPDCGEIASGFGSTTPMVEVAAGAEIRFGIVKEGTAPDVLDGNLEGLLGTYVSVLESGKTYSGILAGTTNPLLLALNPDLRSTKMTVFQAPTEAPSGAGTPIYAGHFSTDLPAVQMTLHGPQEYSIEAMKYGEFSEVMLAEPGQYVAEIELLQEVAGKAGAGGPTLYLPVTIGEGGGLTGILLSGFFRPEENLGGPALGAVQTTGDGPVAVSALAQKQAARGIILSLMDTSAGDERLAELLFEALLHLDASLVEDLWLDGRHLVPETGETVFDEETNAIRELEMFAGEAPGAMADQAMLAIFHLVAADDVLATALIGDATAVCGNPTCERELGKARAAVAEARALLGEGQVQRSIRSYARAWEAAKEASDSAGGGDAGKTTPTDDVPGTFDLESNYPNPFNPVTTIGYALPRQADVRLEVFDVLGRRVALLAAGPRSAGRHEVSFDAATLAGGVYLYRLTVGSVTETRTMTLLK